MEKRLYLCSTILPEQDKVLHNAFNLHTDTVKRSGFSIGSNLGFSVFDILAAIHCIWDLTLKPSAPLCATEIQRTPSYLTGGKLREAKL